MASELHDAVSNERIEAAVDEALKRQAQQPEIPLGSHARTAVHEIFCTCVRSVADGVEHDLSAIHAALVADILRRAERRLLVQSRAKSAEQRILV